MDINNPPVLIKSEYGYYYYSPPPSEKELQEYYASKYYQQGVGSYAVSYTDDEISYFKLKAWMICRKSAHLTKSYSKLKILDIGCGEGWALNEFKQQGHDVYGLDFSKHGIAKCHPQLLDSFEQGNIYELVAQKAESGVKFDIILLANVIEHVVNPETLLQTIKKIMHSMTLLIIVAPNDFSVLHEVLVKKKKIAREFWLSYPDHLSYFNKESMSNFLSGKGFEIKAVVADNPIDLNLFNDNSNYINEPQKGKQTHMFRVFTDNFLSGIDPDKLLQLYEILGSMGVGRDLSYYCSLTI